MKDMVCAISAGKVEDKILVDLNYEEDSHEMGVDIPVAVLHNSKQITLLQMDGEISPEDLRQAIELAKNASDQIYEAQKAALKDKFLLKE
jgi:exosome complex component RRP41